MGLPIGNIDHLTYYLMKMWKARKVKQKSEIPKNPEK